ncbi:Ribonuclease H [Abeliophyllum distichum]|uniref:Ribonuclease H n=1 Tax=Abeliophyllum distichum TaxID=126358 RepID=A0ABD1UJ81_9LAMI
MAEYKALIAGLRFEKGMGTLKLQVYGDSQLVVNQINKSYQAKDERMASYSQIVEQELKPFVTMEVRQIPRTQSSLANALARLATSEGIEELENIPIGRISNAVIDQLEHMLTTAELKPNWMDEIIKFLKDGMIS